VPQWVGHAIEELGTGGEDVTTPSETATDYVSGRRGATFGGLAFLLLVAVLGPVVPARAAVTHVLHSSFETKYESAPATFSPVSPRAIAVDESSGSVYVISESPARITKYDADGSPSNFSALGSNTINFSEPFAQPREIAVDNSGGLNSGDIYVGRSGFSTGSSALVYLPSGTFVAQVTNSSGAVVDGPFCGSATNTTGDLFLSHPNALLQGPYIDKYHPGQWLASANPPQQWSIAGTMVGLPPETCKIAVDSENSIYVNNSYVTGSGNLLKYASTVFDLEEPPSRTIDTGSTYVSIDTSTDDAYSDRNSSIARFDSTGQLREIFGIGDFEQSPAVAIDSATGTAYVSVLQAEGTTRNEVKIYKTTITPDITNATASTGPTSATVAADIGTAGAGNVTGCKLEYGISPEYGSEQPCTPDAGGTPYSGPQHVTVDLTGLEKETTYHYGLTATNANGTTTDIDGTFTTHNVADVSTDPPTDVTQSTAMLNGSFSGNGEATSYYFEWGVDETYGNQTAVPPGEPAGSPTGHTGVSAPISGLSVYLPSSPAYHYRLVATNGAGTTYGPDREFNSAPPLPPQVSDVSVAEITPTSAMLSATVNPANGPTVYSFDYGMTPAYGLSTPVSESVGEDEVGHPVSSELSELSPGTTYHFRAVATNFGGTTHGPDQTFATPGQPTLEPVPGPSPSPPSPSPGPGADCSKLSQGASRNDSKARALRRKAAKAANPNHARALRRRAARFAKTAKQLSRKASACRSGGIGK
jgi:hypothetical protein